MRKLLITGARGQLGQDVQKECLRRGIEFTAVDLPELDICGLAVVRACVRAERPNAIVNCAAYNDVDGAETEFEQACRVNGIGPRHLALAAEEAGVPLIHFSTDYVFDGRKTEPYTIADAPNPISRYGQSKLLGEQEVRSLTGRHFVVRLSWVFGAGNVNFVRRVLQWARGRDSIRVVTDQVSCPAYTADLAPAVLDLLASGAYGLYHLTNAGHCSRYDWARQIVELAGLDIEVRPADGRDFPTPASRPAFSAMDSFPLPEMLGRGLPDWRDATRRFLEEIEVSG